MNTLKKHKQDGWRRTVLKSGTVSFEGTRIGCSVLNMSTGGAGLVIESDVAMPSLLDLEIDEERIRRRCLLVWRNERQIGVSFNLD